MAPPLRSLAVFTSETLDLVKKEEERVRNLGSRLLSLWGAAGARGRSRRGVLAWEPLHMGLNLYLLGTPVPRLVLPPHKGGSRGVGEDMPNAVDDPRRVMFVAAMDQDEVFSEEVLEVSSSPELKCLESRSRKGLA